MVTDVAGEGSHRSAASAPITGSVNPPPSRQARSGPVGLGVLVPFALEEHIRLAICSIPGFACARVRRQCEWFFIDCPTRFLQVNAAAKRSGCYAEHRCVKTMTAAEFL